MKPTPYFVYSTLHGIDAPEPPNSPYTITWHLGRFLREQARALGYEFAYRNLDDLTLATVNSDDILIGHTMHPDGWMNRALDCPARGKFILQPYQHFMVGEEAVGWIKSVFAKADHLLLITGPYWWETMHATAFADWKHKATRVDMAINPARHPHSKTRWNPPGKRRFLSMGRDAWYKGIDLVADLARMGGFHLGYFGDAQPSRFAYVPQIMHYGGCDFIPAVQAAITREYDGFISLARGDANPTSLLETACWGLLPLCNKESGYYPDAPFIELRQEDTDFNLGMIDDLQHMPEYALRERAAAIRRQVIDHFTWDRFCSTVWAEVEKRL